MNKKYIIYITLTIIAIISLTIILKIIFDYQKEAKIRNEIKIINNILTSENIEENAINKILDRTIIEKGEYKLVEKSIKLYYKDLYSSLSNLYFLLDEDNFSNYLSIINLKEDKPTFIKSKNNLQDSKNQIIEQYNDFYTRLTDESIKLSYIVDKNLSNYNRKFYLEIIEEINKKDFKNNITQKKNNIINKIPIYNEALDFLIVNKGHWEIRNNNIIFDTTQLYEEYSEITKKITKEPN